MKFFTTKIPLQFFKTLVLLNKNNGIAKIWVTYLSAAVSCFYVQSAVFAQGSPAASEKNQWACEVLMCLASAAMTQQEAFCAKPLNNLREHIGKWNQLSLADQVPLCQEAKASGTSFEIFQSKYSQCPAGMQTLGVGISLLITNKEQAQIWQNTDVKYFVGRYAEDLPANFGKDWDKIIDDGIGDGKNESVKAYAEKRQLKHLTCVAGYIGKALMPIRLKDDRGHLSATVEKLEWLPLYSQIVRIAPPEASFWYRIAVQNQTQKSDFLP